MVNVLRLAESSITKDTHTRLAPCVRASVNSAEMILATGKILVFDRCGRNQKILFAQLM
jgi:hypothetical protein